MQKILVIALCFCFAIVSCTAKKKDHQLIEVKKALKSPIIDGKAIDNCWNMAQWQALDQNWLGDAYTHEDFSGRYKLSWDTGALYILVEITDDVLSDRTNDPLELYWEDDTLEFFIDEDNSGGDHTYSYNAFAYHMALDGNVIDLAPDKNPRKYNNHILQKKITQGKTTIWEVAIYLYDDTYTDGKDNLKALLKANKKIGFAMAYCDNDGGSQRENFVGSVFISGEDKNKAWQNADFFGTLILQD